MLGGGLKRRRTKTIANDAAKLIPHVIGRYAELMEKHGGTYMDESWLPLDKPGMKTILKLALTIEKDEKNIDWLKAGWLLLADFQPGIGETPVTMPELPEDFAEARQPEFLKSFEEWSKILDRVTAEMRRNEEEMEEFLRSLEPASR